MNVGYNFEVVWFFGEIYCFGIMCVKSFEVGVGDLMEFGCLGLVVVYGFVDEYMEVSFECCYFGSLLVVD